MFVRACVRVCASDMEMHRTSLHLMLCDHKINQLYGIEFLPGLHSVEVIVWKVRISVTDVRTVGHVCHNSDALWAG